MLIRMIRLFEDRMALQVLSQRYLHTGLQLLQYLYAAYDKSAWCQVGFDTLIQTMQFVILLLANIAVEVIIELFAGTCSDWRSASSIWSTDKSGIGGGRPRKSSWQALAKLAKTDKCIWARSLSRVWSLSAKFLRILKKGLSSPPTPSEIMPASNLNHVRSFGILGLSSSAPKM